MFTRASDPWPMRAGGHSLKREGRHEAGAVQMVPIALAIPKEGEVS